MILQPGKKFLQGAIISLSKTQQNADAMPNSIDLERIMKPILKGNFVGDGIFVAKDNMSYFLWKNQSHAVKERMEYFEEWFQACSKIRIYFDFHKFWQMN